ncbi:hypothetical protein [Saccharopolyspora taberi]|uniref:Uncharacterized protein n=1 Tax=Saccharopolyspora taberi TaxID=60895 RepID=A0ABN3UZG7_9PSEU
MTITRDQVRAARDAGTAAGNARRPAPNPYYAAPLKPWELARMTDTQRAEHDARTRERRALAHVWQQARRRAIDAH